MKVAALCLSLTIAVTTCWVHDVFAVEQVVFAAINGRVIDPSYAVIVDATLGIRNKQTSAQRIVTTEREGR